MKNICLRLVLFGLLGTALLFLSTPKALAKDSYGLTWTVSPVFSATPSAVAVDLSDNVYYAGFLASGSGQQMNPYYSLDPSNEPSDSKTATTGAIFLTKMKLDGTTYDKTYIWQSNQINSISLTKIATDSAKNVWLLGSFTGNVNFDPTGGADYHQSGSGGTDTWQFLTEIKADGSYGQTFLWQNANITLRDMLIDGNDNIFVAGTAANAGGATVNLNPLGGNDSQILSAGDTMGFYTKLAVGAPYTYAYSRTFKNTGLQHLELDHIASTSAGNIFLYGVFGASTQMNFNLNNGGDHYKTSNGGSDDLYLNEYNQNGAFVTTYIIGGSGAESAQALGIDHNNNIYFSGGFNSTVNFNPINPLVSPDNKTANIAGQRFLTKLNSNGSYGYTVTWDSNNSLSISKIAFDSNNLIYLVGISAGTTNYDPIGASDSQLGFGGNDAFMTVLNPDKTYGYTYVWGGSDDEKASDAAFNSLDDIYIAGSTKSLSLNFDPTGVTSVTTTFSGGENGYVTQFSSTPLPSPTPSPTPAPGNSENNSSSSSFSSSVPGPVSCTNPIPAAPKIFQIWATQTTATIYFVPSADPQNSYTISYGLYSDAEMYNVTFNYSDKSGAIPYTINALNAGTPYYFKVRANNGCMPGEWSNTLSLKTAYSASGGNTAYASSASVNNVPLASTGGVSLGGSCTQYTVLPGDSFWTIAQKILGAGNRYLQIWNANKTKFPSLNSSSTIRTGWTLSVGC